MLFFNDWPLWSAAALLFCLSFAMAFLIDKLPVWCQSSWFIVSVWGITWVNVVYGIIHPEAWGHIYKIAFLFYAALPGMAYLDHLQKRSRVSYWQKTGNVPESRIVYLSELLDRLAFWWTKRRISCDDELEISDLPEHNNGNSHNHDIDFTVYRK